ncbi:MAG: fatty acid cis/trans isomerase, partial [Gammaproteobacteria bacterium]|nr:fatty acid cis/trans isomerase [Gammaproteobacteria bacterium]
AQAKIQIDKWEQFLNGSSNKERLTSRYIYEHLFLGHMHFAGTPDREFYRLVRSRTAPGEPIDEIATTRPFDYPGTDTFYYRLRKHDSSIVAKSHVVYELSDQRLARFKELFLDPAYTVDALPSYDPQLSANPFATFEPIPATSRYKFMLDDSRYFIEGFIKGPVCRGQVALNVIADHFWVVFLNPDKNAFSQSPEFMRAVAETLEPPNADVNSFKLLSTFTSYKKNQQAYMDLRDNHLAKMETTDIRNAIEYIWDGDGVNPNAGLTIYRHFDSASVMNGLVGHYPETSWIIDYPLFERIHYLLVAGFDVYGNVGHQLNSRLYMDFLRMEGEDTFLFFLPVEVRTKIRDSWYEGIREKRASVLAEHKTWATTKSVKGYRTDDPQREFYQYIGNRLGALGMPPDSLDRCAPNPCDIANATLADRSMAKLSSAKGESLIAFPDIALVRIGGQDSQPDETFSIILNKDYKDLTSIFSDEDKRDRSGDTLDVSRGIVGSYPNFFFDVDSEDLDRFVTGMSQVKTRKDYENMVALFGVRRTNARFWQAADWFQASYAAQEPVESGILDLNRYQDR